MSPNVVVVVAVFAACLVAASAYVTEEQEKRSKVTFDIEPAGQAVRLTVTHDDFVPDSEMRVSSPCGQVFGDAMPSHASHQKECSNFKGVMPSSPIIR